MRCISSLLAIAAVATLALALPSHAEAKRKKQQKTAKTVTPESEKIVVDPTIRPAATLKFVSVTPQGLKGDLSGTMLVASTMQNSRSRQTPLVLIVSGSGPTDRDGNSPAGISASSYAYLASALADEGISSVRFDKRGMYGSASAIPDANAVTIADYANDVNSWVDHILKTQPLQKRTCIWLLGHSEGGLVSLAAAQGKKNICGIMLIAAPGRKLDVVLREQLAANLANGPVMPDATRAIDALSAGRTIDVSSMHPALQSLFNPSVQPFLIDMFSRDPAKLAASTTVPMLIVGGGRDIQVSTADADVLAVARPNAQKVIIADMNHVLKSVSSDDRAANIATYTESGVRTHPELVKTIVGFVNSSVK